MEAEFFYVLYSDVDPDPKNFVNVDPDPGRKITKFISSHLLTVKKKNNIFKSVP